MKDFKGLDLSDYFRILWRRRWYAIAAFILIIIGSLAYSMKKPDVFRSSSMILVETPPIPRDYVRPSDVSTASERIDAVRQQIQSRSFIERMIQEFQLFGYGTRDDFTMDAAVLAVRNNLAVQSTSRNTFLISYVATDAQLAQAVTRRIVDTLIQSSNSSRKSRAIETDQFLDEQLRQTELELQVQEERIREFKSANLDQLPKQVEANINALPQLEAKLEETEKELDNLRNHLKLQGVRLQERSRLAYMTQGLLSPSPSSPRSGADSESAAQPDRRLQVKEAALEEMLSKYTANHPDVVRLYREVEELKKQLEQGSSGDESTFSSSAGSMAGLADGAGSGADELLNVEAAEFKLQAELINNEILKKEEEKESILLQIRAYQARIRSTPLHEQQLAALERQRTLLERQYTGLMNDKFQSQLTTNLETNRNTDSYRIIDEANLPEKPVFPDRKQIAFMGLGAAFLFGIGAAFGRELLDSTLSSEEEAVKVLKLPVLVSVYEISRKHARNKEDARVA